MVIIEEVELYVDEDGKPLGYASVRYTKVGEDVSRWQSGIDVRTLHVSSAEVAR